MVKEPLRIANTKFTYIHDDSDQFLPPHAVDTHHIIARRSVVRPIIIYLFAITLVAYATFLHLRKGESLNTVIWSLFVGVLMVKLLILRPIVKESVRIMPAFGVQLETHYGSGRIDRSFVPASKILKPVLNEIVTPVTCYWCLSFLVRGEEELMLVFKEFRPPLKMLVPIWKALCSSIDFKESSEPFNEDG